MTKENPRPPMLRWLLLGLALVVLPVTGEAVAQGGLEAAKSAGLVGERPDGMLGLVSSASSEVKRLVDDINARRLARYQQIAARNGTSVEAVQAIAGRKLVSEAPPGTYVMDGSGQWRKK